MGFFDLTCVWSKQWNLKQLIWGKIAGRQPHQGVNQDCWLLEYPWRFLLGRGVKCWSAGVLECWRNGVLE